LKSFFSPTKSNIASASSSSQPDANVVPSTRKARERTHKLFVSDSKTRASGSLPRESDTLAGRLQVMMYKELLDAMLLSSGKDLAESTSGDQNAQVDRAELAQAVEQDKVASIDNDVERTREKSSRFSPAIEIDEDRSSERAKHTRSANLEGHISGPALDVNDTHLRITALPTQSDFSFSKVFNHLSLDRFAPFSESFLIQAKPIITGNGLASGASEARCLGDMVNVWGRYVERLGLGELPSADDAHQPVGTTVEAQGNSKGKGKEQDKRDCNTGKTEDKLQLVYRRAGRHKEKKKDKGKGKGKRRRNGDDGGGERDANADVADAAKEEDVDDEDRLIQLAIEQSLTPLIPIGSMSGTKPSEPIDVESDTVSSTSIRAVADVTTETPGQKRHQGPVQRDRSHSDEENEREEDELAWAVEMSLLDPAGVALDQDQGEKVVIMAASQGTVAPSTPKAQSRQTREELSSSASPPGPSPGPGPGSREDEAKSLVSTTTSGSGSASGSIIGHTTFKHSPGLLSAHLERVLGWWMGEREAQGVTVEETRRCGWCEFEEGCEWRWVLSDSNWWEPLDAWHRERGKAFNANAEKKADDQGEEGWRGAEEGEIKARRRARVNTAILKRRSAATV
jgi:exonuclease V